MHQSSVPWNQQQNMVDRWQNVLNDAICLKYDNPAIWSLIRNFARIPSPYKLDPAAFMHTRKKYLWVLFQFCHIYSPLVDNTEIERKRAKLETLNMSGGQILKRNVVHIACVAAGRVTKSPAVLSDCYACRLSPRRYRFEWRGDWWGTLLFFSWIFGSLLTQVELVHEKSELDRLNAVSSDVCSRFVFPCYVVSEQGLPTAT